MVRSLRRETDRTSNAYFESINLRRFGFRIDPTDRQCKRSAEGSTAAACPDVGGIPVA
jgi:hypothetical protein